MKKSGFKHSINTVLPCIGYGALCGVIVGAFVFLFKFVSKQLELLSKFIYSEALKKPIFIPLVFVGLVALATFVYFLHKKIPEVKGGGIPRSEGILRGVLSFRWLRTFVGTVVGSLMSFFAGLPLGSEGPAVLIGTSLGGMCGSLSKRRSAWSRHIMSGGAGAGFAVATGAPISGMLFVIEEVHKKFAPMLIVMVSVSVLSATYVNRLLCSIFGISAELFSFGHLPSFDLSHIGYLLILGVIVSLAVGVFDASITHFTDFSKRIARYIPNLAKLIILFVLVGICGFCFPAVIYSGHSVIEEVVDIGMPILWLFLILLLRMGLLLLATDSGATGGIYIPTLTIGVLTSAITSILLNYIGMPSELLPTAAVLGMCSFLGGTLRSPFTALVFFIEITEGLGNAFFAAVVVFVVNIITALFDKKPFYDKVLDSMQHSENEGRELKVKFFEMKVSQGAFVVGKSVRDIMWPYASVIVSISRDHRNFSDTDLDGEKRLHVGDTLVLRARTYDEEELKKYLYDLVGIDNEIIVS